MTEPTAIRTSSIQPVRRRSPIETLILLTLLAAVLLVFIAWLGDWRRRHNIDALMQAQTEVYASMTTDTGLLPLNLEPTLHSDPNTRPLEAWLTPDEARVLRGTDGEIMIAWTVPLVRALGRNERAVIFFQKGKYEVRWVPLEEFTRQYARQIEEIGKRTAAATP